MKSSVGHKIKHREHANDVFITPVALAKTAIAMVGDYVDGEIWFDPFKGTGNYYNNFPCDDDYKAYCEITEGLDFFAEVVEMNESGIICSNPPYSCLDKVLTHSIACRPRVINYLIGINNLTARRLEMMVKAGYGLTKLHMCKVFKWYGMSIIVQFELGEKNMMTFDREVWREGNSSDSE
jgi:hypothetical protein